MLLLLLFLLWMTRITAVICNGNGDVKLNCHQLTDRVKLAY